jgi:hypothetical protein
MKRREWFQLIGTALAGAPQAVGKTVATDGVLKAGEFSISVPEKWKATALIEKVPSKPLYTEAEWKAHQADPQMSYKPSYENRPEHWALRFPAASPKGIELDLANAGDDPTASQILIHKASEWPMILTDGKHEEPGTRNTLKGLRERMDAALVKDDRQLSPAFADASQTFMCLKQRLDFDGGHGVRMLAQWTIEPQLLRRGELQYFFFGMSDDDSCQILATFPVILPGLPTGESTEHLGRSLAKYEQFTRNFAAYSKEATTWLGQHAGEITPGLDQLDAVIKSLVARRWT